MMRLILLKSPCLLTGFHTPLLLRGINKNDEANPVEIPLLTHWLSHPPFTKGDK